MTATYTPSVEFHLRPKNRGTFFVTPTSESAMGLDPGAWSWAEREGLGVGVLIGSASRPAPKRRS
jgi:hypothetical protein